MTSHTLEYNLTSTYDDHRYACGIFIRYYHRFLGSLDIASSMDCSYEAHRSVCIQFSVSKLVSHFRRSAVHHIAHLYRRTLMCSTVRLCARLSVRRSEERRVGKEC